MKRELDILRSHSLDIQKIIDQSSTYIRKAILDTKWKTPWPIHPSDLDIQSFPIPEYLNRFLLGLLTTDVTNPSKRVKNLVGSFSQDIVYATTCGKTKPPKQVLVSYGVKTLTGNVELMQILNRFGHGISYSQLEENDTALCLEKMASNLNQSPIIPRTIQANLFTNLAWDNIDRLEETLTGTGTTHRVNGIIVQPQVYGPHLPTAPLPGIEKRKQRTIAQEAQPINPYVSGERVGPQSLETVDTTEDEKNESKDAGKKNFLWLLARNADCNNQKIPGWTGFNIQTRNDEIIAKDIVGYLPTINAPATELKTVNEILCQSEEIRKKLNLKEIVVVMDQVLYAKAAEIIWIHPNTYRSIVLRLGTFHTICNLLSIIGKRFEDAGLRDLCIESGVIAEGSISKVLEGKMYNRAVRVHKCIYEALMRLVWQRFAPWVEKVHADKLFKVRALEDQVMEVVDNINQRSHNSILESTALDEVYELWSEFLEHLRCSNGEQSTLWMSYVDLVDNVLLALIRASREGNWLLHLHAVREMIPWCFAYDKVNYSRYLPVYLAQMKKLPNDHPEVHRGLMEGYFSVQLSENSTFGRLPVDQTTEVTINKDTKTAGGVTKFSLKTGAVNRFYMTAEYRCSFLTQLKEMVQVNQTSFHHGEMQAPRISKDEKAVDAVQSLIQSWNNPFAENQNVVSISTAKEAPQDVRNDLLQARSIGEREYEKFKNERLESTPPKAKFHDPLKQKRLKTFSSLKKQKKIKTAGRAIILKADRTLFGRMIIIGQSRKIEVRDLLSHSLGPLPWALATPEGLPRKTNKAALAAQLRKDVQSAERVPENSATSIDAMSLVQKLNITNNQTTFGSVAHTFLSMALNEGGPQSTRIDIVFDTYRETSIKNVERSIRGQVQGIQLSNITASQIIRQWRTFLTQMKNKTSLIGFLAEEFKTQKYQEMLQRRGKILYITSEDNCWKITGENVEDVPELTSSQEEADTRLILHAAHAAQEGYQTVIINSEDTDVFVLLLVFSSSINTTLLQKCGSSTRTKLIGEETCRALIGMHAYTGCDSVSAFAGKGKSKAMNMLKADAQARETFIRLGEEWVLPPDLFAHLEKFTCDLYSSGTTDVNDARYNLCCSKNGEIESFQLPPCKDCLQKHALRANFQAGIWRRSLQQNPTIPSPSGKGWKFDVVDEREELQFDWMDGKPAPDTVLELLACHCTRSCKLPKCVCLANGLKCTDICTLKECDNQVQENEEIDFNSDSDDTDDEDDEYIE